MSISLNVPHHIKTTKSTRRGDLIAEIESRRQAFTVESLADLLQVSRKFIYRQIKHGSLPAFRLSAELRLDPATVAAWLRARTTVPSMAQKEKGKHES
jgi:excisionase family DNA binding protein